MRAPFGKSAKYKDAQRNPKWKAFAKEAKEYRRSLRKSGRSA